MVSLTPVVPRLVPTPVAIALYTTPWQYQVVQELYQGQGTGGDQASGPESGTRARGIKVGANLGGEALSGVGKLWEMGDQGGTKVGPRRDQRGQQDQVPGR